MVEPRRAAFGDVGADVVHDDNREEPPDAMDPAVGVAVAPVVVSIVPNIKHCHRSCKRVSKQSTSER